VRKRLFADKSICAFGPHRGGGTRGTYISHVPDNPEPRDTQERASKVRVTTRYRLSSIRPLMRTAANLYLANSTPCETDPRAGSIAIMA